MEIVEFGTGLYKKRLRNLIRLHYLIRLRNLMRRPVFSSKRGSRHWIRILTERRKKRQQFVVCLRIHKNQTAHIIQWASLDRPTEFCNVGDPDSFCILETGMPAYEDSHLCIHTLLSIHEYE